MLRLSSFSSHRFSFEYLFVKILGKWQVFTISSWGLCSGRICEGRGTSAGNVEVNISYQYYGRIFIWVPGSAPVLPAHQPAWPQQCVCPGESAILPVSERKWPPFGLSTPDVLFPALGFIWYCQPCNSSTVQRYLMYLAFNYFHLSFS